ncbi:MAG: hypothetical protein J7K48_01210 [Thermococcus sp.]|uniref:Uncharacterized protein n=1 Tax=Thermococcus guaymasensis DSM 11113 TaxID=1432656 RepID=A0A0X1KIB7_9EURY|nr:hypothetical protein [Thermococcus guaymasensis]AJC71014.1 hypothetical protein X802_01530 [Thermococcus guaymasensis DSM 11113]MCD6523607.1 hypothetical protein [Thermococcus sp.]
MDERLIDVRSLIDKGQVETALLLAESIKEPYWRDYALKWVAEAYSKKDPEMALKIAEVISTESLRDEAFASLSYLFSREGNFKLAIEVAKKIRSEFTRKKALRAVATVLAKAIVERGAEVSLSELGLDESDVEALKPLPGGISLKGNKLMPGGEILKIKGEFRNEVIPLGEVPKKVPEKPAFGVELRQASYFLDYLHLIRELAKVDELEYWAGLVEEPLRSELIESAGMIYFDAGLVGRAFEAVKSAEVAENLAYLLALRFVERGELEKVYVLSPKFRDPVKSLVLLRELAMRTPLDRKLVEVILKPRSEYLLARLLKFLAFEMLGEAKKTGSEELLRKSRKIFEMGVKIQREFEDRLLYQSSSSSQSSSHSSSQSSSSNSSSQSSSSR